MHFADSPDQYTLNDIHSGEKLAGKKIIFGGMRKLKPLIKLALEALNADLVISDILAYAFTESADELSLPTIVYYPHSITSFTQVTGYMIPTKDNLCGCCGIVCVCPTFTDC